MLCVGARHPSLDGGGWDKKRQAPLLGACLPLFFLMLWILDRPPPQQFYRGVGPYYDPQHARAGDTLNPKFHPAPPLLYRRSNPHPTLRNSQAMPHSHRRCNGSGRLGGCLHPAQLVHMPIQGVGDARSIARIFTT